MAYKESDNKLRNIWITTHFVQKTYFRHKIRPGYTIKFVSKHFFFIILPHHKDNKHNKNRKNRMV